MFIIIIIIISTTATMIAVDFIFYNRNFSFMLGQKTSLKLTENDC